MQPGCIATQNGMTEDEQATRQCRDVDLNQGHGVPGEAWFAQES